ncbi:hypothetical protein IMG5_202330 [Ichthyophthirius multifiliis]|uniref:TLDc domain-containing protein n=1 Tax=Ichthyophthirius multifiliis TaxID=5932 RepID=G0R653_ICHMU|nr:hypothetical protein IMG5_202330 [Ichthyophthirius multifiliis]EGR27052.1 hypothetical protein IMG5_202330 [Ichthyophthirius multifiliis]|eukprot:XP_004023936.1 hypothetical protein IMG5_202330 [Ichthyophthirius multifiliis]
MGQCLSNHNKYKKKKQNSTTQTQQSQIPSKQQSIYSIDGQRLFENLQSLDKPGPQTIDLNLLINYYIPYFETHINFQMENWKNIVLTETQAINQIEKANINQINDCSNQNIIDEVPLFSNEENTQQDLDYVLQLNSLNDLQIHIQNFDASIDQIFFGWISKGFKNILPYIAYIQIMFLYIKEGLKIFHYIGYSILNQQQYGYIHKLKKVYYGSNESFVFQIHPKQNVYYSTNVNNNHIYIEDQYFTIGSDNNAIRIESDLNGKTFKCDTYGNPPLNNADENKFEQQRFNTLDLEVYALCFYS